LEKSLESVSPGGWVFRRKMRIRRKDVFGRGIMFPEGVFKDRLIFRKPWLSRKGGLV
jgi:hypothetical protein